MENAGARQVGGAIALQKSASFVPEATVLSQQDMMATEFLSCCVGKDLLWLTG